MELPGWVTLLGQAGGWGVALLIMYLWVRSVAKGDYVAGSVHREMRQAYKDQLAAERKQHHDQLVQVERERDAYLDKLLKALELGEALVEDHEP